MPLNLADTLVSFLGAVWRCQDGNVNELAQSAMLLQEATCSVLLGHTLLLSKGQMINQPPVHMHVLLM